jgi:hypothetical protein
MRDPCRGVILKSTGATLQLRVQLGNVNQRATEAKRISIAKIHYEETFSENTAEE